MPLTVCGDRPPIGDRDPGVVAVLLASSDDHAPGTNSKSLLLEKVPIRNQTELMRYSYNIKIIR